MGEAQTVLERIDRALDEVRVGLAADGFALRVQQVTEDGWVDLVLEATPEACLECLVGDEVLRAMLQQCIAPVYPALRGVRLEKRIPEEG
jgi:hypothetical protein